MAEESQSLKQVLLKHFQPGDASMKSTGDLFAILDEHAPGKFKAGELYDVLVEEGFETKLIGDTIVWLVQPKGIRS